MSEIYEVEVTREAVAYVLADSLDQAEAIASTIDWIGDVAFEQSLSVMESGLVDAPDDEPVWIDGGWSTFPEAQRRLGRA